MKLPEAGTETLTNYIEISSALDRHPSIRDELRDFLERWRESEVFQQAASDAYTDILVLGPLKATGKMAENDNLMKDAMGIMKNICKSIDRIHSRLEFLLKFHSEEEALRVVTREYLLYPLAEGLGFVQQSEIQRFFTREIERVDPKQRGLVFERTPDGRASIYYSYKHAGPAQMGSERFPFKMWPPVILPEDTEIGIVLYFLTSSWGIIKQKEVPLKTTF